jgi:uncharacterized membrane protein (UPF0127 family)
VDPEPIRFRDCEHRRFLGFEIPVATTCLSRLLGLALLPRERAGAGLLIPGCQSVHTLGMRFRLDLFFFDVKGRVVEICRDVPPGRLFRCRTAVAVLELPSALIADPGARSRLLVRNGTFLDD